jgi:hypothetical protein
MYDKKYLIEWKISLNSDCKKWTLEKTEWAIKNGQSRDTSNIGNTRHRKKQWKLKRWATQTSLKTWLNPCAHEG